MINFDFEKRFSIKHSINLFESKFYSYIEKFSQRKKKSLKYAQIEKQNQKLKLKDLVSELSNLRYCDRNKA